jgi:hypothetical protein
MVKILKLAVRVAPPTRLRVSAAHARLLAQPADSRTLVFDRTVRGLRGAKDAAVWQWGAWEPTHVMVYRLKDYHAVIMCAEVRSATRICQPCTEPRLTMLEYATDSGPADRELRGTRGRLVGRVANEAKRHLGFRGREAQEGLRA